MTDDEILREFARISHENFTFDGNKDLRRDVLGFARSIEDRARAEEREACAKIVGDWAADADITDRISAAIRERKP